MTYPRRRAVLLASRWGAALLCLLASFAFALRDMEPPLLSAPHAAHGHADAASAPHERAAHSEGHCPFCFTAGFALEVPGTSLDARAPESPRAVRLRLTAASGEVRAVRARGPPLID